MVDGFKSYIRNASEVLSNSNFQFNEKKKRQCGIWVNTFEIAFYHTLKLEFNCYNHKLEISGSLHKYFNSKFNIEPDNPRHKNTGYNYNDFSFDQVVIAIIDLADTIGRSPEELIFSNIEFGINIRHFFNTKDILRGLLLWNDKELNKDDWYNYFKLTQYCFKIYDKGAQYGLNYPLVRLELKYKKMEQLNKLGLFTFNDLISNISIYESMRDKIIHEFSAKLIFFDYTIDKTKLKGRDKERNLEYRNPKFWHDLEKKERHRLKTYLNRMIERFSQNVRKQLCDQIQMKWNHLLFGSNLRPDSNSNCSLNDP